MKNAKIFVVDDNRAELFLLEQLFKQDMPDSQACFINSSQIALDLLAQMRIESLPDILFIDINMPGYDGFEFLERLKKEDKLPPFVVVISTSDIFSRKQRTHYEDLFNHFIPKPMSADKLNFIKEAYQQSQQIETDEPQ